VDRPAILFVYDDAGRSSFEARYIFWVAAEVGFRCFAVEQRDLRISGRETAVRAGVEILGPHRARVLGESERIEPRVIIHRMPAYRPCEIRRCESALAGLERANPDALISFHPSWREMGTKWGAELCLRAGEQADVRVPRPTTYLVEKDELRQRLGAIAAARPLIFKPSDSGQSRGILLSTPDTFDAVAEAASRSEWERYAVQHLVEDPVLFRGKKFDLRVYVLVTSFKPLRYRLYREGIVKIAAREYDPAALGDDLRIVTAQSHRTRQGLSMEVVSVSELLAELARDAYRVGDFWDRLEALVGDVFTCLGAYPPLQQAPGLDRHFYLGGLDVIMTRRGNGFDFVFLETNHQPQLFGHPYSVLQPSWWVHRQWLSDLWRRCRAS
jgi:hypothetical protein